MSVSSVVVRFLSDGEGTSSERNSSAAHCPSGGSSNNKASSHPRGGENSLVPLLGRPPIPVLAPLVGSIQDASAALPLPIPSILMVTGVLLLK